MKTFARARDEQAKTSIERYNNKDPWVQYEMRKCGQLSYVQGWNECARFLLNCAEVSGLDALVVFDKLLASLEIK